MITNFFLSPCQNIEQRDHIERRRCIRIVKLIIHGSKPNQQFGQKSNWQLWYDLFDYHEVIVGLEAAPFG